MRLALAQTLRDALKQGGPESDKDEAYFTVLRLVEGQIANAVDKLPPLTEREACEARIDLVSAIKLYRVRTGATLLEAKVLCVSARHWVAR